MLSHSAYNNSENTWSLTVLTLILRYIESYSTDTNSENTWSLRMLTQILSNSEYTVLYMESHFVYTNRENTSSHALISL